MDMDLNLVTQGQFTNYSSSSVTIQGAEYKKNILIFNDEISEFEIDSIKNITLEDIAKVINNKPDLIIFGTGNSVIYPDFKLLEKINGLGIGFEIMPIPALCRTYNFLISEDRKVACILFFE
ncbi:MAG: hypothetical protein K0R49_1060 [Burkholderiales bacterium]|jgi:uncharacterized protein|nr:hypothetical protein [Burkholderiales bacterium]MCE3268808.1 hypothetical protein [Burkholderiales bacterium]